MTTIVLVLVLVPAAVSAVVLVAWWVDARARQRAWRTIASARRAGPARVIALDRGSADTCPHCRTAPRGAGDPVVAGRFRVPHSVP